MNLHLHINLYKLVHHLHIHFNKLKDFKCLESNQYLIEIFASNNEINDFDINSL